MVFFRRSPRTLPVPAMRRENQHVIDWLATEEGRVWSWRTFTDATECHEIIEIHNDLDRSEREDHRSRSSNEMLKRMQEVCPEWEGLTWEPDLSP